MIQFASRSEYLEHVERELTLYGSLGWLLLPTHRPIFDMFTKNFAGCTCYRGSNCKCAGKHPIFTDYRNRATSDAHRAFDWHLNAEKYWERSEFTGFPNWAVLTGERSGITVLDVDPKNGGVDSLRKIVADVGPLPETATVRSGSGLEGSGHYYFTHTGRVPSELTGLLGPGIDILSGGGRLAILPPSRHKSGLRYEWLVRPSRSSILDLPENWVQLIETKLRERNSARAGELVQQVARRQQHQQLVHRNGWSSFEDEAIFKAVYAYNDANTDEWPTSRGRCPMCGSPDGFKELSIGDDELSPRWDCKSTRHQALLDPPGKLNSDGSYSGTQLDIDAFVTGKSKLTLLREGLYLK